MDQKCFVIIKPDALERGLLGRIISRIEDTYLRISCIQERLKSEEWAKLHYAHLVNESFFPNLAEFMTSRSIVGFIVSGPYAVERMRLLVGSTKSWEAAPGTIRGDFGYHPAAYNCIHASDSVDSADIEISHFYNSSTDARQ